MRLQLNSEEERIEHFRQQNKEKCARYYKRHKKKLIAKQKEKRHRIKKETHANDNLKENLRLRVYQHPQNTIKKTELRKLRKAELLDLLKRWDGDN